MPIPIEIVGLGRDTVRIVWDEDHEGTYGARDLRLACRCAGCIDEMTGTPILDPRKVPADIRVTDMALVGGYGLQIRYSDGHHTGIHRLQDLLDRCPCDACTARHGGVTGAG